MTGRVAHLIETCGGRDRYHQLPPREPTEFENFRALWPGVWAAIAPWIDIKIEPDPPTLHAIGPCYFPRVIEGVSFGVEWWRAWALAHANDPHVVREGSLLRSRFALAPEIQERWQPRRLYAEDKGRRLERGVDVITETSPTASTLLTVVVLEPGAPDSFMPTPSEFFAR
jgi:hypothetical protein